MRSLFGATLDLRVRASSTARALISGTHIVAGATLIALSAGRPWLALLLPAIAVSGVHGWRRAAVNSAGAISYIRWHADGGWSWCTVAGDWRTGTCEYARCIGAGLVILTLRPAGARARCHCALFADALDPIDHRRLRVRLRITPPDSPAASMSGSHA